MSDQSAFAALLDRLVDINSAVSGVELAALSNVRRAEYQLLADRWTQIPVERRRQIMRGIGSLIEESFEVEFTPVNQLGLSDSDSEVRATAVSNLWENEDPAYIPTFLTLLNTDDTTAVRAAAASALGKYVFLAEMEELDEDDAAPIRTALMRVIHNKTEPLEVRRRAVESIAFFGDEQVRTIITDAYNDIDESMQVSAVFAMGRSLDEYWSGTVILELGSSNPELRFEAARASGELEIKRAVPALVDLLTDSSQDVQIGAIRSLGQIGGPVARRALELMVESDDEVLAQEAEDALGELQLVSSEDWLVYDLESGELSQDVTDIDDLDEFDILWQRRDRDADD
jgi:hypothetical protein